MSVKSWGNLSSIATASPLSGPVFTEGSAIYVSTSGNDSYTGKRDKPLLTLSAAITAAGDGLGDIIVLMSGYSTTLTSTITMTSAAETALWIVGEGVGSSKARIINNVPLASTYALRVSTAERVRFQNINFAVTTLGANVARCLSLETTGAEVIDCDFGINQYSGNPLYFSGTYGRVAGCSFAGAGTLLAAGTSNAIYANGGHWVIDNCSFTSGGYGRLVGITAGGGALGTRVTGCTLANNSHIELSDAGGHVVAFDSADDIGDDCSVTIDI